MESCMQMVAMNVTGHVHDAMIQPSHTALWTYQDFETGRSDAKPITGLHIVAAFGHIRELRWLYAFPPA